MKSTTIALLIGIAIFLVGCIQPSLYEDAKESGYEVEATVVDVDIREDTDMDSGFTSTVYTVYGDYTVDGKEYKHEKIGKYYDSPRYVGEKIMVVVDPKSGTPMFEGGILCTIGFVVMVIALLCMRANKKAKKAGAQEQKQ